MRNVLACLMFTALELAAGCSSGPGPAHPAPTTRTLPNCAETGGYPPCEYDGMPYPGPDPFYPADAYPYFPGSGVIVVPEPVLVPVPAPTPRPKPPKRPPPPPKHRHPPRPAPCHPLPGHPCP